MMEKPSTCREYVNPIKMLEDWGFRFPHDHITVDPDVEPEYRIYSRKTTHDGTLIFTLEALIDAMTRLVEKRTYYKPSEPDWSRVRDIRYTIGLARLATVFGLVDLPCGRFPGQRERITIPVRCEDRKSVV